MHLMVMHTYLNKPAAFRCRFQITETLQRPDLIVWSEEQRHIIILELTVPWEDNIKDAELRKEQRHEELTDACVNKGT